MLVVRLLYLSIASLVDQVAGPSAVWSPIGNVGFWGGAHGKEEGGRVGVYLDHDVSTNCSIQAWSSMGTKRLHPFVNVAGRLHLLLTQHP